MGTDILVFLLLALVVTARWLTGEPFLLPLAWLAAFSAAVLLRESRVRKRTDFINQLKSHRKELRHGGSVVVDNLVLRYNSVLTTFHLSVGGLFVHIDIPSRYQPASRENHPEAFIYSICSLVSGWWSFPHGPLRTINALMFNLRGGEQTNVAALIDSVLLERHAEVQKRAVEMHRAIREWEKEDKEKRSTAPHAETGPGSKSQQALKSRPLQPEVPTFEDRIREFYSPTPVGTRFVEDVQKRALTKAKDAKERLKKAVRRGNKE